MMRLLITALLLLIAGNVMAATRYVDDRLVITMRTGQGKTYQIIETLPSGTRMELLEDAGEYSRVRLTDGREGWVLTQYLTATPVAKARLASTLKKLEQLQAENKQLQQQLSELNAQKSDIEAERSNLSGETQQLQDELAQLREVAAKPIETAQENRQLKEQLKNLKLENNQLVTDNEQLKDRSEREWFMTGAAVLVGGIFLGLLLPLLRRRKKSGMFD